MIKRSHLILTAGMLVAATSYAASGAAYAAHEEEHEHARAHRHEHEAHDDAKVRQHRERDDRSDEKDDDTRLVPGVSHPVTLSNQGSFPLDVEIKFRGANPRDFAQNNDCGEKLQGQSKCVINVTFAPRTRGAKSATMEIHTSGGTKYVYLTGTGI